MIMPMHKLHLAIVKKVNNSINRDLDKLMLGSILPNLTKYDHNLSHFRKDNCISDINIFLEKYSSDLNDDVMLGYYIHLLTDNYYKNFFNTEIIEYDDEGNATGYIFNGQKKEANIDLIKETIKKDYDSFGKYLMDHGYIDKFSSDECVKSVSEFTECNVDSNTLYDYIISINMDVKKHSKKSFFKRFKGYKFRLLPKEMYMDLMNKCVDYILENLK